MRIPYYQIDAFASHTFGGNPAGVCVLDHWLPNHVLQAIAAENNQAETAFFTREEDYFHLRWFSPVMEMDLCGHATLAPAFLLFTELGHRGSGIRFHTRSGWLNASWRDGLVELDLPSRPPQPCAAPEELLRGLGGKPREVFKSRDYLAVFDSPKEVAALTPDFRLLLQVETLGIVATAAGGADGADFVSRFFAPRAGIDEDPATGSSHCTLVPFWSERLGKRHLFARQLSRRGAELFCRDEGERVAVGGRAVIYSRGELDVPVV